MDRKFLPWILGGGAVVAFLVLRSSSGAGGATTVAAAPDTSATDQARFGFLGQAVGSLADLEKTLSMEEAQLAATKLSTAASVSIAQAQADADKTAARESSRGKRGGGLNIGPFHLDFHF